MENNQHQRAAMLLHLCPEGRMILFALLLTKRFMVT